MQIKPYSLQNLQKRIGTTNFASNVYVAKSSSPAVDKEIEKLVGAWFKLKPQLLSGKDYTYPNIENSSVYLQSPPRKIIKRLKRLEMRFKKHLKLDVFKNEHMGSIRGALDTKYQKSLARII